MRDLRRVRAHHLPSVRGDASRIVLLDRGHQLCDTTVRALIDDNTEQTIVIGCGQ